MRRFIPSLSLIVSTLSIAAASACSPASITGEVDGNVVPPFLTGMVYQADELTPDDDTVAVAAFYTFSNGCDLVAKQMNTKDDGIRGFGNGQDVEKLLDDVHKFEEDNFPGDYWSAYAVISASSESDIADKFDVERDPAGVLVCHHTGAVDASRDEPQAALLPDYAAPFSKDRNRECFTSKKGEIRVSEYDGKSMSLIADVDVANDAGDNRGKIELGGVAAQCDATERAVRDLLSDLTALLSSQNPQPAQQQPSSSGAAPNDSCQFAFDGVCDEPNIGSGACAPGTDASDCGGV